MKLIKKMSQWVNGLLNRWLSNAAERQGVLPSIEARRARTKTKKRGRTP